MEIINILVQLYQRGLVTHLLFRVAASARAKSSAATAALTIPNLFIKSNRVPIKQAAFILIGLHPLLISWVDYIFRREGSYLSPPSIATYIGELFGPNLEQL